MAWSAADVVGALLAVADETQLPVVRRRLAPDEPAIGVRMHDLFEIARAARDLPLPEVDRLFADPRYEPRMAAACVLDFRAKRRRVNDAERAALYACYLGHLDRITTWDMVDRAAPSVVGGHLADRSRDPLHELTASRSPLARRIAITAPLWFVRHGDTAAFADLFDIAAVLAADMDPVVHLAVGIALKHAGGRDPAAVEAFLDAHAAVMPRAAVRSAASKLAAEVRHRFVPGRPSHRA